MLKSEFPTIVSQRLAALCPNPENRFAIAYSGGGDSTALLHSLKKHPQLALVLIVDHGLRIGSLMVYWVKPVGKTVLKSC